MPIAALKIIGESINDSVPSTHKLFEDNDLNGIMALAKAQDVGGATYIDVNVGLHSPAFMADMVKQVQQVTAKPLAVDTPDPEIAAAGLEAYDAERAGNQLPLLNSIAATRLEMFDLYKIQPFRAILLSCEREENGESQPNKTAQDNYNTAKFLVQQARERCGMTNDDCIIDPGIAPIGSDTEGLNKATLDALAMMHEDSDLQGIHASGGLSNFTVMLPPKRADGSPVKSPLESAFLTMAMPLGLDMCIGSVKRNYRTLDPSDEAYICVKEALDAGGYDSIMRVMTYYS